VHVPAQIETDKTREPFWAVTVAKLIAVVVLPTPLF
jgi:hypothetical protein